MSEVWEKCALKVTIYLHRVQSEIRYAKLLTVPVLQHSEVQQDEFYSNCHILGPMAVIGSEGNGEIFSHNRAC